jgi:hypothetical protein
MTKKRERQKIARTLRQSGGYAYVESFKLARKVMRADASLFDLLCDSKSTTFEVGQPYYCYSCGRYHYPCAVIGADGRRFEVQG